jgi:GH15 family glucan-1,4-alpha-glucosidase
VTSTSNGPQQLYPPIGDYGLIGDCHGAALVSRAGSIDWCTFHRVDASPIFARILDWERGGHWQISTADREEMHRRYVPDTNVLENTFTAHGGHLRLTDCFVTPAGDDHPPHRIVRLLEAIDADVEIDMVFRPRFEYGLTVPRYEPVDEGLGIVYGGSDGLVLEASHAMSADGACTARSHFTLERGRSAYFVLTYQLPHELEARRIGADAAIELVEDTKSFWTEWSGRCTYEGAHRDAVVRSALVLKALTNTPTGAIVAAPTTSFPEEIGGVRNWDYRYAWLRDAALNLYSLFSLGYTDEAHAFMAWVKRTTAGLADQLQILYGVGGERRLPEIELGHLDGYRGSKPVRIGNAATEQFQLDVYGYVLDTAWLYHRNGGDIDGIFWTFLVDIVDVVAKRWAEPDDGIWEVRGGPRQFVSSKVLVWVAVDRAIRLAEALSLPADVEGWKALRAQIRAYVEEEGTDPKTGAFTQEVGGTALDASTLLIPLVRFLAADDARVVATMDRIRDELTGNGLVYRYLETDDGVPGDEATFAICSFWLVDNLALAGRLEEATELFERLVGSTNDLGLMAEEIDPATGELLGNFPQAFSHVGLIGAARNLDRARRRSEERSP